MVGAGRPRRMSISADGRDTECSWGWLGPAHLPAFAGELAVLWSFSAMDGRHLASAFRRDFRSSSLRLRNLFLLSRVINGGVRG
jgi:hypothetical protein